MSSLPKSAQLYIATIFGLGAFIAGASFFALAISPELILPTLLLTVLIAIFDLIPVDFPGHHFEILPSTAIKLAAVLLVPPPALLCATALGTLFSEWRVKRSWYKMLFNAGALTVTYSLVCFAYNLVAQAGVGILASPANVVAVFSVGVVDVAVNSLLISMVIALAGGQRVSSAWSHNFKPVLLHEFTMLPIGVFVAMLWNATPFSVVFALAPLMLARRAYQMVVDLEWQTREALMALARVLDERDEATSHHCELVASYSEMTARQLGLSASEIDVISRAAWLHDIGKVGMRNDILFKAGALTAEEREHAKRHAAIGGDLLLKFPLFEKGSVLVRNHHEWYNGAGYPDQLAGEQIPLGARILAVADAFQAMTDERPYRKPMTEEAALEQLRRGCGTQFDPTVVEAFFRARGIPFAEPERPALSAPLREQVGVPAE